MNKEDKKKKFTTTDAIVLVVLIIILIPFLLSILEGFIKQDYQVFFINLGLSIFTIFGIIKYIKKLIADIKSKKK